MKTMQTRLLGSLGRIALATSLVVPIACSEEHAEFSEIDTPRDEMIIPEYEAVTLDDVAALAPGEMIVLDMSADSVFVLDAEVWAGHADVILVSRPQDELTLGQWLAEGAASGAEYIPDQSLSMAREPALFGLSAEVIAIIDAEGSYARIYETSDGDTKEKTREYYLRLLGKEVICQIKKETQAA